MRDAQHLHRHNLAATPRNAGGGERAGPPGGHSQVSLAALSHRRGQDAAAAARRHGRVLR